MICTGSVTRISAGGTGQVVKLSCCGNAPPQQQELVRRWKQKRRDLFNTLPLPWGRSSFHSVGGYGIAGPPAPGEDSVVVGKIGLPFPEGGPPTPGGSTRQDDAWPGGSIDER